MKRAWEAGYKAGTPEEADGDALLADIERKMGEVDWWGFDLREEKPEKKAKKTSSAKKGEKKASPKKPEMTNELADFKNYNPTCCKARQWNKKDEGDFGEEEPGHGMQCWRPISHDGYCEKCAERMSDPEQDNWGDFDKPLKESPGHKANGGSHPWKALKKTKEEKPKKEKKEKKVKKEKKPKKEKKEKKEKKVKKEKKEDPVVEEEPVAEENPNEEPVVEETPNEEDEQTQEMEDELGEDVTPEMVEYDANGFSVLWNKKTNQLLDPDDGEVMGNMVADEAGEWKPVMKEEEEEEDSDDSDDDSDEE